jgi:2-methylisocitrate lyase-like PEP mutase family enzyme
VSKPVNVVAGIGLPGVTITELEAAGVRRISVGSAFARVAYGAMIDSAERIIKTGSFAPFMAAASFSSIETLIKFVNLKQ